MIDIIGFIAIINHVSCIRTIQASILNEDPGQWRIAHGILAVTSMKWRRCTT